MKLKIVLFAAVLASAMLFSPINASAEPETAEVLTEESAEADESGENSKLVVGALMLGAVFAAAWVSMLIFRPRDKTKYL